MKVKLIYKKGKLHSMQVPSKGGGYSIILMSTPMAIHILTAIKGYKESDTNKSAKVRLIANACGVSTWVTIPVIIIATLLADIISYDAATGATRTSIWRTINTTVKSLMRSFQNAADLAPANSELIILSGGFGIKKVAIKQKNVFHLTQGISSGTLICVGDTVPKAIFHAWWISRDGINFTLIMSTGDAENILEGLAPGRIWIQHQYRTRKGPHGPIKVLFIDLI